MIKDKYAKYKKAYKEGKIVEYALPTTEQWNVVDNLKQHFRDYFKYRIKAKK